MAGLFAIFFLAYCQPNRSKPEPALVKAPDTIGAENRGGGRRPQYAMPVAREIRIREYFRYIDSIVQRYDSLTPYHLTEHLLLRANPWVIDTLENTDYYRMKDRGIFVYDQRQLPVLHPGDSLCIPDSLYAAELQSRMARTWIDINIPEYRLRIVEGEDTLFSMVVRVGQNKKRFQEALGRVADLRTQPGVGKIVRINREPAFFEDPHTGRRLTSTLRDDGKRTRMPLIPWLEPELNGRRLGQMIHPTTNPETVGMAWSNGCIGCKESDAWRLYYYAPIGTKIVVRYDLQVVTPAGDTISLPDIYGWKKRRD